MSHGFLGNFTLKSQGTNTLDLKNKCTSLHSHWAVPLAQLPGAQQDIPHYGLIS